VEEWLVKAVMAMYEGAQTHTHTHTHILTNHVLWGNVLVG